MNDATNDLDTSQVNASQYADNIGTWATGNTVASSMQKIQQALELLERWCKRCIVTLNPLKSQLTVFTKCFRHKTEMENTTFTMKLFGHDIHIVPEGLSFSVLSIS